MPSTCQDFYVHILPDHPRGEYISKLAMGKHTQSSGQGHPARNSHLWLQGCSAALCHLQP